MQSPACFCRLSWKGWTWEKIPKASGFKSVQTRQRRNQSYRASAQRITSTAFYILLTALQYWNWYTGIDTHKRSAVDVGVPSSGEDEVPRKWRAQTHMTDCCKTRPIEHASSWCHCSCSPKQNLRELFFGSEAIRNSIKWIKSNKKMSQNQNFTERQYL